MRLAVIVDGDAVQRFALNALNAVTGTDEISVYSCTNTRIRKRWFRHAAYYALNLLTVRNQLTRSVPVAEGTKNINRRKAFASGYDGVWQVLPSAIVEELNDFDVVLKFGMGLLKVPPPEALSTPILSYHHGDPDYFRGRPAGFWEMTENASAMGQVVQVIGDRLDAGKVVAFAETKVFPWSYRATLKEAYRHSPLIMDSAVRNAISGVYLSKKSKGRNCRLPSNLAVAGFVIRTTAQAIRRLLYGAFWEKAWQVSKNLYSGIRSFGQNLADGKPNEWYCRAGARYLYICENGLVHYCSQQRGYPGTPLELYTTEDIQRAFMTPKSCAPFCTIGCVHRVSTMDYWRSPQASDHSGPTIETQSAR